MPHKKSPLLLRTMVIFSSIVYGAFILSVSIKHANYFKNSYFPKFNVIDEASLAYGFEQGEVPYLHLPKPSSFIREECAWNMVRFFVIMSMQRSGSGWFETLLNSHPNVSSNGEIFRPRDRRGNASMIYRTMDRVYNLDWFSSASKNECTAAVGFKWMLNQGILEYHNEITEYFKKRGVHTIFLFRRNHLRRLISLLANNYDKEAKPLNGTHKSHVHSPREAQVLATYKPSVNIKLLVNNLEKSEEVTAKALEYFRSTRSLILYYEDVMSNQSKLIEVQDFLRLPHRNLSSCQVKIHNGPLCTQIENWKEVQKTLEGTAYERFIQRD